MVNSSWVAVFVNRAAQLVNFRPDNPEAFVLAPPCKEGNERTTPCSEAIKKTHGEGTEKSWQYQNFVAYRSASIDVASKYGEIPNGATNIRCFETIGINYVSSFQNPGPYYVQHDYQCEFDPSPWGNSGTGFRAQIEKGGTIFITQENFDALSAVYNLYKAEMEKELGR